MWLKRLISKRKAPPVQRPSLKFSVERPHDWHANEANVTWAKLNLYSPEGRLLQAHLMGLILEPKWYSGDKLTQEQAAMEYARMSGVLDVLRRLQEAAISPPKILEDLPADYDQTPPENQAQA